MHTWIEKGILTWLLPFVWPRKQSEGSTVSLTGRTKAYYLRELIERGIGKMEDYYLAADVLKRVRKGQEQVHSSAEVRERPWPGGISSSVRL